MVERMGDWFPSLAKASNEQLGNWQILGDGDGIHWPDLDEDSECQGGCCWVFIE